MRVLSVIGARPQFITSAVVSHQLIVKGIDEVILDTGQHTDDSTSHVFFEELDIPDPKYSLGIHTMNHGSMVGRMLEGVENTIILEKPDIVLVYGDNNSALAGALAASKLQVPVAHIEAGLRSFNMKMPEEINRILTDRVSNLLFCPTAQAMENLNKEGFDNFPCKVVNTGDVLLDAAIFYGSISSTKSDIVKRLGIKQSIALATISRLENLEDSKRLIEIITALNQINREQQVILPLHSSAYKFFKNISIEPTFKIIPPLNYFDTVELIKSSSIVLTDSNVIQREAFFFGKCCVTFRNETEWTELVQGGFCMLGSIDSDFITIAYQEMMSRNPDFSTNIFGKGKSSELIAEILKNWNK